ncbi:MAG: hypothetical protein A2921_02120 [Candidatus Magasanikbacteria bacterium RIFCSPLOWO2_01_FULL_43_20b]|uniref:Uncharacterized protein n=1 Tax=Candidatus Magasanikbacteria bacterium RIFCSPLOWO2_12_FULL_43_12 TaxID=1798692 RepID=A0A1F6MQY3_9BACT|nr:MAG: hypothetical protein A3C74_01925 [Candidatus Magasanikbacteria bacterium RIFCSPHIGHO2_02_FULL_44_13]OGH73127.1 MAG: hypothetical protein A2921_02120 [Candidatus Magasanikbacteria bacterium RIFCSPLOWO2_01_FULL_43_20b]OGH74066.1 MAG: hypothetical protein A3G00_02090 [Candidatus Magasanikbacteria bacterium RIFCSPLOWO2_12_FULL_43_12]
MDTQPRVDKWQKLLVIILVAVILVVIGLGWYIFDVMNSKLKKFESFTKVSLQEELVVDLGDKKEGTLNLSNTDSEVGGVVEKVSKHILLPTGEITVATVNDAEALRRQNPQAFKYIKNGDRLLISAEGIIMYDPIVDKVVDVAH